MNLVAHAADLPLHDSSFDVVVSTEALEHDPRWQETLAAMIRLCRVGGLVILTCSAFDRHLHDCDGGADPEFYRNLEPADLIGAFSYDPILWEEDRVAGDLRGAWVR